MFFEFFGFVFWSVGVFSLVCLSVCVLLLPTAIITPPPRRAALHHHQQQKVINSRTTRTNSTNRTRRRSPRRSRRCRAAARARGTFILFLLCLGCCWVLLGDERFCGCVCVEHTLHTHTHTHTLHTHTHTHTHSKPTHQRVTTYSVSSSSPRVLCRCFVFLCGCCGVKRGSGGAVGDATAGRERLFGEGEREERVCAHTHNADTTTLPQRTRHHQNTHNNPNLVGRARPKSQMRRSQSALTNRLEGLRSRCKTPALCTYLRPRSTFGFLCVFGCGCVWGGC